MKTFKEYTIEENNRGYLESLKHICETEDYKWCIVVALNETIIHCVGYENRPDDVEATVEDLKRELVEDSDFTFPQDVIDKCKFIKFDYK